MRSVEARYRVLAQAYQGHSTFVIFGRTVQGQNFTHRIIAVHFRKLVQKDDYAPRDKSRLLQHLYLLSKATEDGMKRGQISLMSNEVHRVEA